MLARLLRWREKKIAPYSLEKNIANYVFTTQSDCTEQELILFLLDLHMYVNPLNQEEMHRFPDPTECVQYSFVEEVSTGILRKVDLLKVLRIGFLENSFESADALRSCSDDDMIKAVRDLAVLANQVSVGRDYFSFGHAASVMPLDGILACIDIMLTLLNTGQCFLEREYTFTSRLLSALAGLFHVLNRIGSSIGHSSNDVTKYQWTQCIGQATKYLSNLAINVTVHNVNCTMDMDKGLPPLHGSRVMGLLVTIMEMLASCVVRAREWCHPEAASTVTLLFWSMADTVADAVLHLQSKDVYILVADGTPERKGDISVSSRRCLWDHKDFISVVTHIMFTCVSNASPAPQDMLAGIGRLAGRSNDSYSSDLSQDVTNETSNMLNWCAVAHTITGFKCLLRAAIFSATGDRIALPRQNEWVAAIAESLLFCLEFGYKSRNLTLLAPVVAELLLQLIARQSDCSISVDTILFELTKHMNKFSEACKKKARIEKRRKKKKRAASGFRANHSKSSDASDTGHNDLSESNEPEIKRAVSAESRATGRVRQGELTVDNFRKHNLVNKPKISRVNTDDSSSFDEGVSVRTDYDEFMKSPARKDFRSPTQGFFGSGVNKDLYPIYSNDAMVSEKSTNGNPLIDKLQRGNLLQPLNTPYPASPAKTSYDDAESPRVGNSGLSTARSSEKKDQSVSGQRRVLSPTDRLLGSGSNSNVVSSPRAPRPHTAPVSVSVKHNVGQAVDCRITMKNETIRWFPGKIEQINSDGTYDVRFDDGDLGQSKMSEEIRVSKRSGRMSARSTRLPSQRTESNGSIVSSTLSSTCPAGPAVLSTSPVPVADNYDTANEFASSCIGGHKSNPPTDLFSTIDSSQFDGRGKSLDLRNHPIAEISSASSESREKRFGSMSFSIDEEDKQAVKPYPPSQRIPSSLPAYGSDLSSVVDFEVADSVFQAGKNEASTTALDKFQDAVTEFVSRDDADIGSDGEDDDGLTFTIPSVFAEADIARRAKMGDKLVSKINFDNIDLDVTAAMNGAAQTSLSGGIVRDNDTTAAKDHSDSEEDEDEPSGSTADSFGLAYLYDMNSSDENALCDKKLSNSTPLSCRSPDGHNETDSEIQNSHSKDSSYSYSNSSGFGPVSGLSQIKRVPSLKGFSAATKQPDQNVFQNNTLGSFNMTSKNALQPPRPSSVPTVSNKRPKKDEQSRAIDKSNMETTSVNGGGSVLSNTSGSDITGADPECQQALQRTYALVAMVLLERSVAQRDRIEEKFCRQEETVTTNRSRNSSFRAPTEFEGGHEVSLDYFGHRNVVFAVRDFLETAIGAKSFAGIAANASLVDQSTTRLLKLVGEQYFDSCLPSHMDNAKKLAEGAFGNVYSVKCPALCSRCYSRRPMRSGSSRNLYEDSVSLSGEDTRYAIKRIARERTVHDLPVLIDVFTEVSCLEILSRNKGVCRLFNYGVQGGEYWLVLEEGKKDLLNWRLSLSSLRETCSIADIMMCVALFEDACVIVRSVHEAGIIHFDLKCSNFLLRGSPRVALEWWNSRKSHEYEVLPSGVLFLADFGESLINKSSADNSSLVRGATNAFSEQNQTVSTPSPKRGGPTVLTSPKFRSLLKEEVWPGVDVKRARGSLFVQSPEMLTISSGSKSSDFPQTNRRPRQKNGKKEGWIAFPSPSYPSDVWSLGCLLVELVTMSPLFAERAWPELYCLLCMKGKKDSIDALIEEMIDKFVRTDYVSKSSAACLQFFTDLKKFIPKILVQRPSERPSITFIVSTLGKMYPTLNIPSDDCSISPSQSQPTSGAGGLSLPLGDQSSVDSWDPNYSESSYSVASATGGKKPSKSLKISTSNGASKYAETIAAAPVSAPMTVIDVEAKPGGVLYPDVHEYIASAVDSFDNAKMTALTSFIGPALYVDLSLHENDIFSYDLSSALVVDITTAPSALYEYGTSNMLGECMNKIRNGEKCINISTHNRELVQKTFGYLHKDKRLVEILLVCDAVVSQKSDDHHEGSDIATGCFSFRLMKRNSSSPNGSRGRANIWVPWGGRQVWGNRRVYDSKVNETGDSERRQVYKFNLGIGNPQQFFECFKEAVILVHDSMMAGHTVVFSISGRSGEGGGRDADNFSRPGSSRWTIAGDGPAPALSARSISFESNMKKLFHSCTDLKVPSARSLADSRDGDSSVNQSSVGTRITAASGMHTPVQGEFSRPLVSALTALVSFAAVITKTYSCFYDQPVAPIEKMAPWLLRGSQKETVVCLIQYARNIIRLKPQVDKNRALNSSGTDV